MSSVPRMISGSVSRLPPSTTPTGTVVPDRKRPPTVTGILVETTIAVSLK
jgi:hypothetical protein